MERLGPPRQLGTGVLRVCVGGGALGVRQSRQVASRQVTSEEASSSREREKKKEGTKERSLPAHVPPPAAACVSRRVVSCEMAMTRQDEARIMHSPSSPLLSPPSLPVRGNQLPM